MMRLARAALCVAMLSACGSAAPEAEEPPHDPLQDVDADALFARGMELGRQGDFVRSEQYVRAAIAKGYSEERAIRALLRMYLSTSRVRAAIDLIEPYIERHPEEWRLRYLAATLYLGLEQPEKAYDLLVRTIETAPAEADPVWTLAVLERDAFRRADRALILLNKYLELAPQGSHAAEAQRSIARNAAPEESRAPVRLDAQLARDQENTSEASP